jgi:leucyl-tRNA synthetase
MEEFLRWYLSAPSDSRHEPLPESELPLEPPALADFKPTGTGEPPLAKAKDWIRYSDTAVRETNTMPQWAGSCWYYLRFCDPRNEKRFVGEKAERYWMGGPKPGGVDLYVGGTEHAVLHLLYARFWHKVLFDLGYLSEAGAVSATGESGHSRRRRTENVEESGQRGRSMKSSRAWVRMRFAVTRCSWGPLEQMKPWSMKGIEGVARFLPRLAFDDGRKSGGRVDLVERDAKRGTRSIATQAFARHDQESDRGIETLSFNTAIAQMMVLVNAFTTATAKPVSAMRTLLILLNPLHRM